MSTAQAWIPADTFGARLRNLRFELGMTVEEIAKKVGVAHPTWSTWERGARPRDKEKVVQQIVAAVGCDRDWLMWGRTDTGGYPSENQHFRDAA
jgi:transcriptional regulator with XRE-family HTH domain